MIVQLLLGSVLIAATALAAAWSWWVLELILVRSHRWVTRPPHGPKLIAVLSLAMLWTLLMMTASVWIWAVALWALGIFVTFEASVYFALVAFTTLGFGDILLPVDWRLLGGLAAANGLLIFGLLTAMLVETLRQTRLRQRGRFDDFY
ncbi:ion channel [Aestuariicoccus sp. MJ-SS9]|uniref:ion channel n=1 Tax=Aestuariicoccus sp. MJ-SS9 TaxID=3079855 RepID=UPI002909236E|nr:ion channel [Aestuariicoccus sp. MJ-SS9]MDU8913355.1 ion channel [Aestuariicoccus sp. MJ-SS9]